MRGRRGILAVFVVAALGTFAVQAVFASTKGAHFFSASSAVSSTGQLLISWDEAGVGNQNISYSLDIISQSAVYACYTKSGNHPQASNKEGPSGPSSVDLGTFSPTNGRVTEKNVPVAGTPLTSTLSCPSGQILRLVQVTYSLGNLTDTTNNVSISLAPGPGCASIDTKNFPCP